MANLFQPSIARVLDENGDLAPGAKLYVYLTETTNPAEYYLDQDETVPGTNPQVADSTGRFTPIYLVDSIVYRIYCETSDGSSIIYDVDPVRGYDEGMINDAAQDAIAAAISAENSRAEAEGFRDETEGFRDESETFRNETEGFRNEAEGFRDEAEEQADLATTAATTGTLRIQTNPATPTTPPSGATDGQQYWAVDAGATKLILYLNTAGTGAPVTVSGEQIEMPLQPALDAVLAPVAPADVTGSRTLTSADTRKTLLVNIPVASDDVVATVKVPSNSEEALPLGTTFKLVRTDGARIRPVSDETGSAVILGEPRDLAGYEALAYVEKVGTNDWRFYGELETPSGTVLDPGTHEIIFDASDFDTLFEDTAETIPFSGVVGGTVCSVRNKGTLGGSFTAPANDRGYTLELIDGTYMLVPASATSALRLPEAAGMNLAEIDMFIGFKVFEDWATIPADRGFITFQSATNSGVNRNDGGYVVFQGNNTIAWRAGTPAAIASGAGVMNKYPHVLELWKPGNSANTTLIIDGSYQTTTNASSTVTSLSTLARDLVLGAQQANNGEGIGGYGNVGFSRIVGGGDILTTEQRRVMREWTEAMTYGTVPHYPEITTLDQVSDARDVLIEEVFGTGNTIPTEIGTISTDSSPRLPTTTNVAAFEKITMTGYTAVPRLYTPNSARTDVFLIEIEGHATAIGGNGNSVLIQDMMNNNIPTLAVVLPNGPNDYTSGSPTQHLAAANSYAQWVGPVCIAINTMLARYPGATPIITGISGGGWASLLCGAVDARIATTISVVGWMAEYMYLDRDFEQWLNQVTGGYLQLALLAGANGRRCINRLHNGDVVGFGQVVYDSRPDFEPVLSQMVDDLGGFFEVSWDNVSPHAYSTADRALVLSEIP